MRSERSPVFADINDVLSLASLTGPAVRDIERASLSHSFTNNLHLSLYQNFSSYLWHEVLTRSTERSGITSTVCILAEKPSLYCYRNLTNWVCITLPLSYTARAFQRNKYFQRWRASENFVEESSGTSRWPGTLRTRTSRHVSRGLCCVGCPLVSFSSPHHSRWPAGRAVTAPGSPSPPSTCPSCWSASAWWRSASRRWSSWRTPAWTLSTLACPWWWSPISTLPLS